MRALIIKPDLLLLDEPCSNLDPQSSKKIENLLQAAKFAGIKIIFVTHDPLQARRLADDIFFIHKGEIIEFSKKNKFFSAPKTNLVKNYLQGMLLD